MAIYFEPNSLHNVDVEQFMLWQQSTLSDAAQHYCLVYRVDQTTLPHIGLVDPRTGELIHRWQGFVGPEELSHFRTRSDTTLCL